MARRKHTIKEDRAWREKVRAAKKELQPILDELRVLLPQAEKEMAYLLAEEHRLEYLDGFGRGKVHREKELLPVATFTRPTRRPLHQFTDREAYNGANSNVD